MYEVPAEGGNDEAFSPEPDHFAGEEGEWYFDLPNGAWERQEEKNRALRESVRGNIQRQAAADTVAAQRDPFRKKPGAFSFRDDANWQPEAGSSWQVHPGASHPDEDTPVFGRTRAEKPHESTTPRAAKDAPAPPAMPLAFRHSWPEPAAGDPAPGGDNGASWDSPGGDAPDAALDGDVHLVDAMRSWAARSHPAPSDPHTAAQHPLPAPEAPRDAQPSAGGPPTLKLVRRRPEDAHTPAAEAESDEPRSKFEEMFDLPAGGGGIVDSMREWASSDPVTRDRDTPKDISELPAEFLKPFDWELDDQGGRADMLPPAAGTAVFLSDDDDDPSPAADLLAGADEAATGAPAAAVAALGVRPGLAEFEARPVDALALAPGPGPVESPEESAAEPDAVIWDSPAGAASDVPERRPRRGFLGKIFGRHEQTTDLPAATPADEPGSGAEASASWEPVTTTPAEVSATSWLPVASGGAWEGTSVSLEDGQNQSAVEASGDASTAPEPVTATPPETGATTWLDDAARGAWDGAGPALRAGGADEPAGPEEDRAEAVPGLSPADEEREAHLPSPTDSETPTLHAGLMPIDQPDDEDPWMAVDETERESDHSAGSTSAWPISEAPQDSRAVPPAGQWPQGESASDQDADADDPWAAFIAEHEREEPLPFASPATVTPGAPVSWDTSSAPEAEGPAQFESELHPSGTTASPGNAPETPFGGDAEADAPLTRDLWRRAFGAADSAVSAGDGPPEGLSPEVSSEAPPAAGPEPPRHPAWDPATLWARTAPNHGPANAPAAEPGAGAAGWEPEEDDTYLSAAFSDRQMDEEAAAGEGPWAEAVTSFAPSPPTVTREDDPWGAIVAASGYDNREAGPATVYLGKRADEARPPATVIERSDEIVPAAFRTPTRAEPPAAPSVTTIVERWAQDEAEDDTLLRAFEAHASQPDDEPPTLALAESSEAFEPLLGKHAAELVDGAGTIAFAGHAPPATWTPPSARPMATSGAAGTSPFAPPAAAPGWADAGRPAFEDGLPPRAGAFADFGDDGEPIPASAASANRGRTLIRELVETGLLALLVFLAVRASFQNFKVDGSSMFPTLKDGQFLIVNKLVYSEVDVEKMSRFLPFLDAGSSPKRYVFHAPDRGDIIVLIDPRKPDTDLIKRVIGLPGDTVEIADGHVYINGFLLEEPYIKTPWHDNRPKVVIPQGQYFVMGDNRDNSLDSRSAQVGLVPKDLIIGKTLLSYWPKDEFGLAPNGSPKVTDKPLPSAAIPTEAAPKVAAGR